MGMSEQQCKAKALAKAAAATAAATAAYILRAKIIVAPAAIFNPLLGISAHVGNQLRYMYKLAKIATTLKNALQKCDKVSPLILDLDGDGVEADALTHFDHEGDGWNELSRWANEDDGVLVWDRNGDGVINNGSELFGNNTVLSNGKTATNGFAALADLDSNGDGVVNSSDTNWANLRVMRWTDANDDDIMQDSEKSLVTLDSLGIASLNTRYTNSSLVDKSGNEHRQEGSYTKKDGTTAKMTDVWFVTAPGRTTYSRTGIPAQSAAIKKLPDISGGGRVYDLRDAMALDDAEDAKGNSRLTAPFYANTRTETRSLREMVEAFTAKDKSGAPVLNKAGREALAEKILLRWAGAEGALGTDYWGSSRLLYAEARQVAVVEAFQGGQWRKGQSYRNPAHKTGQKVQRGYMNHLERLYGQLMLDSHLSDLHDKITVGLKSGAKQGSTDVDDYEFNFGAAKTALAGNSNTAKRSEFLRSLAAVYGDGDAIMSSMKKTAASWVYEYGYYAEYYSRAVFGGNDHRSNDFVGDCGCSGGVRDNVFRTTGGTNDRLEGRGGNDTYQLGYGTGHDRIEEQWRDSDFAGDSNDVIKLASGISKDKVKLSRTRDDLIVSLYDANGRVDSSLRVVGHYTNPIASVEKIMFEDGTVWGKADIRAVIRLSGQGSDGVDTYDGADGISGILQGGKGSDVYLLGRGSGNDTVNEFVYNDVGNTDKDVVRLKSGLTAADVRLSRTHSDLLIKVLSADRSRVDSTLTIKDYYVNDAAKVERVELSDGTLVWGAADLDAVIRSSGRGSGGVDIYDGGADNVSGVLQGGKGSDVYLLGRGSGNDTVDESAYNDVRNNDRDVVRLKSGLTAADVRFYRTNLDLLISVLSADKSRVDSTLTIKNYYVNDAAKVERVELSDGTLVWGAADFGAAGLEDAGRGNDFVIGSSVAETLSGYNGGNDTLRGGSGNDVYLFGGGSGNDIVDEGYRNFGSSGDVVRLKKGITASDVSLSRNKYDLIINLQNSSGVVANTLTIKNYYVSDIAKIERVELSDGTLVFGSANFAGVAWTAPSYRSGAEISGSKSSESLYGRADTNDVFDSDAGGSDRLYGYGGDDVYWLGRGTGHDSIYEYYNNASGDAGDVIKLKAGITSSSVRLSRQSEQLLVQIVDSEGGVTDSLTVYRYYANANAKVERLEFADGTVWGASEFMLARMRGSKSSDYLYGSSDTNDVFDSDAGGNDTLYGYGGDDVYWLGRGTGHDAIYEHYNNASGDSGDVIKLKDGITSSSVRLLRRDEQLLVQIVDSEEGVTDSLTVHRYYANANAKVERLEFADGTVWGASEFMLARMRGSKSSDYLYGLSDTNDVFDSDAGGYDRLYGKGGDDVYWLGRGTGHDLIYEHRDNASGDSGDVIKLKDGITSSSVRLLRQNGNSADLVVQLLGSNGLVTDSLTVNQYYAKANARVERLEFADGTVWDASKFMSVRIRGGESNDDLYGRSDMNDIFDSDAGGSDKLYGHGGDDVYWLGRGTGHDTIYEHRYNVLGDGGDVIKLKSGITSSSVRLVRVKNGSDLVVQLLGSGGLVTDSLTVDDYYAKANAKVERLEFADGTVWDANHFMLARIRGRESSESLYGRVDTNDVFDSDAGGNDKLYGYGGDDVYWLGRGTGHDTIYEHSYNTLGDAGDIIKLKEGITSSSVRLLRTNDGSDLVVQLLGSGEAVTDSLTVDDYYTKANAKVELLEFADGTVWDANKFMLVRIRGGSSNDNLYGHTHSNDVFDGDAGGNDKLYGYGGNDVYWLGKGTGHDTIYEHRYNVLGDGGDVIKLKAGITSSSVRLSRSNYGADLIVQLLGNSGLVTDSLTVDDYYAKANAKVERLEFVDGTTWNAKQFMLARIRGSRSNDYLYGRSDTNDVFDGDAGGSDTLYGYGGNDVYWLGRGTGHDTIDEHSGNASGDAGDVIKLKTGIVLSSVRLSRSGNNLLVQIVGSDGNATDSLTVKNHFSNVAAKVESIKAGGKVLLEAQYQNFINDMAAFTAGTSTKFASEAAVYNRYWSDDSALSTPSA